MVYKLLYPSHQSIKPLHSFVSPGVLIISSFIFIIFGGVMLLSFPAMRTVEISLLDLIFTATSATCVVGLPAVPLASFSLLGKMVILSLIQIGGLGLMTLSFAAISIFMNFGIADRVAASKVLDFEYWGRIKKFLVVIIFVTSVSEIVGACALYPVLRHAHEPLMAAFYAVFFAVSAFCNAGWSPYDETLIAHSTNYYFLGILGILVFIGSTGFFVWQDLYNLAKRKLSFDSMHKKVPLVSLHTKIVFVTSAILIVCATGLFIIFESYHAFAHLSPESTFFNAFFNAVALRCSGFSTIDYQLALAPTRFFVIILMLIGANPVSTGGGLKTTTLALLAATIAGTIQNRSEIEIFNRTIYPDQIYKALVIVSLTLVWIAALSFALLLTDPQLDPFGIFFEVVSSFSTCGISIGLTSLFSPVGKCLLMVNMIIGRIGILTILLALAQRRNTRNYTYPHERILIG